MNAFKYVCFEDFTTFVKKILLANISPLRKVLIRDTDIHACRAACIPCMHSPIVTSRIPPCELPPTCDFNYKGREPREPARRALINAGKASAR